MRQLGLAFRWRVRTALPEFASQATKPYNVVRLGARKKPRVSKSHVCSENCCPFLPGWQRMALQVLFFGPENIYDPIESFTAVSNRLVVSPIVRKLVFNKASPASDTMRAACAPARVPVK